MRRWSEGYPTVITPVEWLAWAEVAGKDVRQVEWDILRQMDAAYVGAMIEEIKANSQRLTESK